MRVAELMSSQVVTIGPADSCLEAVARMHRAKARHLPVVNRERMLVGIVTDRDIRHHLFSPGVIKELRSTPLDAVLKPVLVAEIMSSEVITISAESDVAEAGRIMREEKIGALPVTDGGRLAGIITETDLLRHICLEGAGASPACAEIIVSYP